MGIIPMSAILASVTTAAILGGVWFGRRWRRHPSKADIAEASLERLRIVLNRRAVRLMTAPLPKTASKAFRMCKVCAKVAKRELGLEADVCHLNHIERSEGRLRAAAQHALYHAILCIRAAQAAILYTILAPKAGLDPKARIAFDGSDADFLGREVLSSARETITRIYQYVTLIEQLGLTGKIRRVLRLAISAATRQYWGRYDLERACDSASQVIDDIADLFDRDDVLKTEQSIETLARLTVDGPQLIAHLLAIVEDAIALKGTPRDYSYPALVMKLLGARAPLAQLPASPWVMQWTASLTLIEAWLYAFASSAESAKGDTVPEHDFLDKARSLARVARWYASEANYLSRRRLRNLGQIGMQKKLAGWPDPPNRQRFSAQYLALMKRLDKDQKPKR